MNDTLQPRCAPGPRSDHPIVKPFGENPSLAQWGAADKPPCHEPEFDLLASTGQVSRSPHISAVTRLDSVPHRGQACSLALERAETTMTVLRSAMPSTINPAGIKEDKRKLLAVALILLRNQSRAAMQNHRM